MSINYTESTQWLATDMAKNMVQRFKGSNFIIGLVQRFKASNCHQFFKIGLINNWKNKTHADKLALTSDIK